VLHDVAQKRNRTPKLCGSGAFVRTRSRQQSDSGFSKSRRVSFLEAYLESSREASGEGGGNRMIVRGDEEKVV
jgi:hypothetical protein